MYADGLPPILAAKFGHLKFIKKRTSKEYSAECPVCGDSGHMGNDWPDRFRMFDDDKPLGWCRSCGHVEFADGDALRPTPEQMQEAQEKRRQLAELERSRLQTKIERLRSEAYWEAWNQNMGESARRLWREAGIPDSMQNYWELGYRPDYQGQGFSSPALTIPYFAPGRQALTVQYRLLNPPKPSDKYRFETGLKSDVWLADPEQEPTGRCLLVEGMKKAGVCFVQLVAGAGEDLTVVAVPSKSPGSQMLERIAKCEVVYIALDPDAYAAQRGMRPAVNRLAKELKGRARIVKLPVKPDDFFTIYNGKPRDFLPYLDQAVSV